MQIIKTKTYIKDLQKKIKNKHKKKEQETIEAIEELMIQSKNRQEVIINPLSRVYNIEKKQGNLKEIYTANIIRKTIPSICPSVIPVLSPMPRIPSTSSNRAHPKDKGISLIRVTFCTMMGVSTEQTPITNIRLKILEPTTLLTASSLFCTIE